MTKLIRENKIPSHGGVTQLVEYPVHTRPVTCSSQVAATRPVGQAVKTPPFHGGNMGSIPVRVTKKNSDAFASEFFLFVPRESNPFKCNAPVEHCPIPAGRDRHLYDNRFPYGSHLPPPRLDGIGTFLIIDSRTVTPSLSTPGRWRLLFDYRFPYRSSPLRVTKNSDAKSIGVFSYAGIFVSFSARRRMFSTNATRAIRAAPMTI